VTTADWTKVAAIAQVVATIISGCGLFFVGYQIRLAKRGADLQAMQEFLKSATEREERLCEAETDEKKRHAFNEFMNFLEIYAAAANKNLLPNTARNIVVDKLCTSIAVLHGEPAWLDQIGAAIKNSTTFIEVRKVCERLDPPKSTATQKQKRRRGS
jgi:hypothetical protein